MTYKHNKKLLTKIAKTKHKINMLNMLKNSLVEDNDMEQLINCEIKIENLKDKLILLNDGVDYNNISDHALVRYLERVKGVDMDAIRKEILTPSVQSIIDFSNNSLVKIKRDDHAVIVNNNTIVTVLPI